MKRSLWMAFLCMGLALLVLPVAWIRIDQEKDDIVIIQEVLSGDPAAAAGITLRIASHWEGHLLWDTEYVIGSGKGAESSFSFSARQVAWERRTRRSAGMDFLYGAGFGTALADTAPLVNPETMPYSEIFQAAAERAAAGKISEETIRISDYCEYYSTEFLLEGNSVEYEGDYSQELAYLAELFQIPTGDDRIRITVQKDQAGEIVSMKGEMVSDRGNVLIADASAFGEAGCYYAFCLESAETGMPSCRGENCGIFYLPFRETEWGLHVDLMQMRKLCPLPEGTVPAAMALEEEKGCLYLAVKEDDDYSLLVYGLASGKPVLEQRISLGREGISDLQDTLKEGLPPSDREPEAENVIPQLVAMTREEGGLLMTWSDNVFAFVTEEEGQCALWCSGRFPDSEEADFGSKWGIGRNGNLFPGERECLFDGERLVLAALSGWESVDVLLAVYTREGEAYSGLYRHSGEGAELLYGGYQKGIMLQGRNVYDWLEGRYIDEVYVQGTGEPVKPLELSGR